MTQELLALIDALEKRIWFQAVGYLLLILLVVWQRWRTAIERFVPAQHHGKLALAVSAAGAFVSAWQSGADVRTALAVTFWTFVTAGPLLALEMGKTLPPGKPSGGSTVDDMTPVEIPRRILPPEELPTDPSWSRGKGSGAPFRSLRIA